MLSLKTPVENLTKVGKTAASKLKRLGILTVRDLIYWYPFRYDDFSQLKKIADLHVGDVATVCGKIELLANKRSPRKRMVITECFLTDETGSIKAIWFQQPFINKILSNNDQVYFSGKVEGDLFELQFKNPSYEKIKTDTAHTARIVPIYSLTEGLTQKQIRFLSQQALASVQQIADWIPYKIRENHNLIDLKIALANIHFPDNQQVLDQSIHRLKFGELLNLHLQNYLIKKDLEKSRAQTISFNETEIKTIVKNLGFNLTDAQRKSAWQILKDMTKTTPMNRLLEGDVGSGKTAVAALAMASTALNGYQSVILAPTEILAGQHFTTLKDILKSVNCQIALFTRSKHEVFDTVDGKTKKISKAKLAQAISEGVVDLIIGTHALIQENIKFKDLVLVIIDEQHRFGVEQRKAIREKSGDKNTTPHLLSMTATPIPRTLALTLYGGLSLSIIDELPPGRKKPITQLVDNKNRNQAYDFILEQIQRGRQAFVICPLIEESDKLGVKAANEEYQKLSQEIFPQLKIGLLHGRLKPKEREEIMEQFKNNKIQILVATSVVEVGVNIPNANVMIIESAERFGLAQLHQFRGRVNRSTHQSYCYLFTENSVSKTPERLKIIVNCYDGFKLAEEDLKLRGTGDLAGTKQSGFFSGLRIASLSDVKLIEEAHLATEEITKTDPNLEQFPQIVQTSMEMHPE